MPVSASSLIPIRARESAGVVVAADPVPTDLVAALAQVADPRARRGVRHRLVSVVSIGVCAVLAGATTFTAIAEWAADLTPTVRHRLGLARRAPSESTIRRVLQAVDPDALDQVVSAWLTARLRRVAASTAAAAAGSGDLPARRRVIAVDGKTARGSRHAEQPGVHLSPRSTPAPAWSWAKPPWIPSPTR